MFVSLESFTEEMPILSPASATTARIRSRRGPGPRIRDGG